MKQSKLLKKSLAALLAILMVAAMIPMSAFAASAPEGVTAIRVNGKSATWDGEKYVVEAEGERSPATVSMNAVVSNDTTHVFLKEDGESQLDTAAGVSSVALSKAAEKPETVGTTGTYKFTLLIGASRNTNTPYQLEINWKETYASRDTGIKAVHNIPNMVGDAVIADGVITIKTKLGATDISSKIFTAIDDSTPLDAATATTNAIIHLKGTKAGKYQTYKNSSGFVVDDSGLNAISDTTTHADNAAKVRANLLPAIFVPNTTGAILDLDTKNVLTVTANGATEKYTVKFVTEDTFTEIKLGDVVGKVDYTNSKITFEFPYNNEDWKNGGEMATYMNGLPITYKVASSGVKLTENGGTNIASGTKLSSISTAALEHDSGTTDKYLLKLDADNPNAKVKIATAANTSGVSFDIEVTSPNKSPVAALTAIKIGNSQVVNIEKGQTTVDVTLPAGNSLTTAQPVKAAALTGTKIDVLGDSGQTVTTSDENLTAVGASAKVSDGVVYLKVTSPDTKTVVNYTINVKVGTASGVPALNKFNLVKDGDVVSEGVINAAARTVTLTVPYSVGKAKGDWTGIVVQAEASDFASVSYSSGNSAFSGDKQLVSGETVAVGSGGTEIFGNIATAGVTDTDVAVVAGDTKAIVRLWTGSSAASAEFPVDYSIIVKKAKVGKQNQVTSAEFTTASKKEDMTAENTFKADVDRDNHIIKVYLPYSVNQKLVAGDEHLRLSALGISDFAVLAQVGASAGNVAAANETVNSYNITPGTSTLGDTIDIKNNWNDYLNTDGTLKTANVVTLRAYSEQEWGKIADNTIIADNGAPTGKQIEAGEFNSKATSQGYSLVAEVEEAQTGYALESLTSTVDTNVTVSGDVKDASHELTLSVPYSYIRNSDKTFTLNYTASPKATVTIGTGTPRAFVSDAGSAETKGATKFSFTSSGALLANGNAVTGSGNVYTITVTAEDGKHSDSWKLNVTQVAAQTEASLKGLTVGKTAGVQDAEDETKWTVVVPNGSDLTKQVLSFETVSPLATVRIGSADFDASKEYDLSKPITFTVVAEDGVNRKVYTLTATEGDPSTEAEITAAKVGEVDAAVAGETITAVVPEDFDFTQAVAVSFTVSEGAKVTKLGEAAPTATYTFTDGEPVAVEVTAQDGETTKTYQLIVTTKQPSSENAITELTVDGIAATAGEENAFTAEAADPANVTLGIKVSEGATVTVNGEEYTAGDSINATEPVTIVVTAEDGTEATYTLTVTKKADKPAPDDVDGDAWYAKYVADVLERGIMSAPNGKFQPDRKVTRAEFAVMMCNLNGVDPNEYANAENPFTDVKNDWSFKWIMAAVDHGWMSGTSKTTFEPSKYLTREMAALIIANTQELTKVTDPSALYADDAQISVWAKGGVYACKDAGLMGGTSASKNIFEPKKYLTRAQIATILTHINPEPNEPENPDEGNTPENPDEGSTPETPDEGNTPENPDEGNTPENPDEGSTPENPDEGNTPETPDEGSTPETPAE